MKQTMRDREKKRSDAHLSSSTTYTRISSLVSSWLSVCLFIVFNFFFFSLPQTYSPIHSFHSCYVCKCMMVARVHRVSSRRSRHHTHYLNVVRYFFSLLLLFCCALRLSYCTKLNLQQFLACNSYEWVWGKERLKERERKS